MRNRVLGVGSQRSDIINLRLYRGHRGELLRLMSTWGVSHNEIKGGFSSGGVWSGVVYVLG